MPQQAWVKIEFRYQHVVGYGGQAFIGNGLPDIVGPYWLDQQAQNVRLGASIYLEVGDSNYAMQAGLYGNYYGLTYEGVLRQIPGSSGQGTFNTHNNLLFLQSVVVDIYVGDNPPADFFADGGMIAGYLPPTFAASEDGSESHGISPAFTASHSRYEWVRADVEVIDLDGNGFDDRGEHDAGPSNWFAADVTYDSPPEPDVFVPQLPPPSSAEDVVDFFYHGFELVSDVLREGQSLKGVWGKLSAALPYASIGLITLETAATLRSETETDREKFIAAISAVVELATVAATIGATGGVGAIVGRFIYTEILDQQVKAFAGALYDELHGPSSEAGEFQGLAVSSPSLTIEGLVEDISAAVFAAPRFDETFYAAQYPDAVAAVADGSASSLYAHFLSVGVQLGYLYSADASPLSPSDIVSALIDDDPASGDRLTVGHTAKGRYFGDGASAVESELVASLNTAAGSTLAASGDLFVLANRIAIDLADNRSISAQRAFSQGDLDASLVLMDGASVADLFPGLDLSNLRIYAVASGVSTAAMALALLDLEGATASALTTGVDVIGVAEYAGVWVIVVNAGAAGATPVVEQASTRVRYGSDDADTLFAGERASWLVGLGGDDMLVGGSLDDSLSGGAGGDLLKGGVGADRLAGGAGDDFLTGGLGNDIIDGGSGHDILIVSGAASGYRLLQNGDDFILKGLDGGDHLTGVEVIRFGDGRVLELNRMYGPDVDGGGWTDGWISEALLSAGPSGGDRPLVLPGLDGPDLGGGKDGDGREVLPGLADGDAWLWKDDGGPLVLPGADYASFHGIKGFDGPEVLPGLEGPGLTGLHRTTLLERWSILTSADDHGVGQEPLVRNAGWGLDPWGF